MKKLLYLLLLSPFLAISQATTPSLIFEISTIKVNPANASRVESGLGEHNKKYHATAPYGVRVYTVQTGTHSGEYKWVMGPGPWSGLDARPSDPLHDLDWQNSVNQYTMADGNTEYIRLDTKLSRFPNDFNVNKLFIRYVDIARGSSDKLKEILEKIHKVYADKIPGETYGVYWNEMPSSSSGRDVTIISFFDKYAWMDMDDQFNAKYDEIFGKGAVDKMWEEWRAATVGMETEIWEYREDLSGLPPAVKAADRQ